MNVQTPGNGQLQRCKKHYDQVMQLDTYISWLGGLSDIDSVIRSTVMVTIALEDIYAQQDEDPIPALSDCFARQLAFIEDSNRLASHQIGSTTNASRVKTGELFEAAWTTFSPKTYDHSVSLVETRLRKSGLDEAFFAGKRCFDGGCGIGRLSIAAAKMGAREVISADIGQASLDYLAAQCRRLGLCGIYPVKRDVVNLSDIPSGSFDFVASYGVLHHTPDCLRGVREHFRITKPGGTFWLYLYGDGGIYWPIYDRLRAVVSRFPIAEVKRALQRLNLREGLIYTYLDNVLAPRTYHYEHDILAMLKEVDPELAWRRAKGNSPIDDVDLCITSKYGSAITGPQGEVRLVIQVSP